MADEVLHYGAGHHEVELSVWPLISGVAAFLVPLAFMVTFQWNRPVPGLVLGGAGIVLLLIGLFGWVSEVYARKQDVGLSKVAILMFIGSEAILFGGLFSSYFYTMFPAEVWPPAGTPEHVPPLGLAVILSVFLLSSSATIHKAEAHLEEGNTGGLIKWLLFTVILGALFLGGQAREWVSLVSEGFTITKNSYGTYFYLITGFHGSHVLVGLIWQIFVVLLAMGGKVGKEKHTVVKACGYYWHFVDVIWLLVLSIIYILPFYR